MDGMDDRRMGCMGGFLQLFDRNHILAGKRLYATKRLPHFAVPDDASESDKFVASPVVSKELGKPQPSPDQSKQAATEVCSVEPDVSVSVETPPKSPLPLPIFEVKEGTRSSWKFCKEAPRLSLDSRAVVDAKGSLQPRELRTKASVLSANRGENTEDGVLVDGDNNQRPCPSVIARLMGLEPLLQSNPETLPKSELRRSASESRVSRDLFNGRFVDGNHVDFKELNNTRSNISNNAMKDNAANEHRSSMSNARPMDRMGYPLKNEKIERPKASNRSLSSSPWKSPQHRKFFFDTADIFPEPKQTVSLYGEIDKRLKMRGIDEPSKDLETLKQILEALQLKGLLHNKRPSEQIGHRNFVYDPTFSSDESPIVLMRPSRSVSPSHRRMANGTSPSNLRSRNVIGRRPNLSSESLPSVSPCRERPASERNARSPLRSRDSSSPTQRENSVRLSSSVAKPKNLNVDSRRRSGEPTENRRVSPVQSPKLSSRRTSLEHNGAKGSPRNKRGTTESKQKEKITMFITEDESSSISESTVSSSFQTDAERSNLEDYNEGRSLLERCDKLLNSIAEITAPESQPSPVSVLDSSFYRDDSPSPSPIMKRIIDFKDVSGESEEEIWLSAFSPVRSKSNDSMDDFHLGYISDILRASCYLPGDSDVFLLLEKQQYLKGKDTSKVSRLQRKLIFDTITEILDRNRQLPPWKAFSWSGSSIAKPSLEGIWTEFQRIQERESGNNLVEIICEVLKKDLAQDTVNGWGDCPVEMSEAVLDMERQIFKDLIVETIQDLAVIGFKTTLLTASRRKLVF
ncbi:protein LONGIFOLIA 1 [Solanum dulcamara]|uniref:protein LONGIFOLIA 1 n=1 Tax=Solanum dulcamara TaxID=45834 RepID=UPI00248693D1|nr:protein LONGIFOLIA 1 [Solanum dulcamara]XP_055822614.1 protein LONGIFOLIA 1 [Solanum dulcamara]